MMRCPNCSGRLGRQVGQYGVALVCVACGGRAIGIGALHKADISDKFIENLWQRARESEPGIRACPHCGRLMPIVTSPVDGHVINMDVCAKCHSVWFNPGEHGDLPHNLPVPPPKPLLEKSRILLMNLELKAYRDAYQERQGAPDTFLQKLLTLTGLPAEDNPGELSSVPLVTWIVALACVIVFLFTRQNLSGTAELFGFIPSQWYRMGGLTLLTSFFLHGDLLHLIFNLYFFLIFGDNVEIRLGRAKFLLLCFAAHLTGIITHFVIFPRSADPLVGASAGIMGIMAFYAVAFPQARVSLMYLIYLRPYWYRLPVRVYLAIYLFLEVLGMIQGSVNMRSDNVAHLAHFGGLACGLFAGMWMLAGERERGIVAGD
jgi:membrane associated rhomboid family serine protease